jgi:hypothetical protein
MDILLAIFLVLCPICLCSLFLIGLVFAVVYYSRKKGADPKTVVRVGSFGSSDDL